MCVIAVKPSGVDIPKEQRIKEMWDTNKDGAGFMYRDADGNVVISKGYMTYEDFDRALLELSEKHDVKDIPMILHFRITTHGGTSAENTHPFPVTSNVKALQALDVKAKLGVAHNGIISSVKDEKTLSDTQVYIRDVLSAFRRQGGENFLDKYEKPINSTIGASKLAFLDEFGIITTFGKFEKSNDDDGLMYSNTRHEPYIPRTTTTTQYRVPGTKTYNDYHGYSGYSDYTDYRNDIIAGDLVTVYGNNASIDGDGLTDVEVFIVESKTHLNTYRIRSVADQLVKTNISAYDLEPVTHSEGRYALYIGTYNMPLADLFRLSYKHLTTESSSKLTTYLGSKTETSNYAVRLKIRELLFDDFVDYMSMLSDYVYEGELTPLDMKPYLEIADIYMMTDKDLQARDESALTQYFIKNKADVCLPPTIFDHEDDKKTKELVEDVQKIMNNPNNIGGNTLETAKIEMNADRSLMYKARIPGNVFLDKLKPGTKLKDKKTGEVKVVVSSDNWFRWQRNKTNVELLYKAKDGAFILVDEVVMVNPNSQDWVDTVKHLHLKIWTNVLKKGKDK